ncbi:hypothetical protein K438DRAFT_530603 [Mycena galopus ATCC 62051]|nr:hypothetical protein K438DRAFT_530603 [Mycena galopus ATCC 62051]
MRLQLGTVVVVAFPCISTGHFACPGDVAARLAPRAADEWLAAHPASNMRVIFTPADVAYYTEALSSVFHLPQQRYAPSSDRDPCRGSREDQEPRHYHLSLGRAQRRRRTQGPWLEARLHHEPMKSTLYLVSRPRQDHHAVSV